MSDDPPDPPRKFYGLKPREFDSVNSPREPGEDALPSAPDPVVQSNHDDSPITVEDLNRTAAGDQPLLGVNGPVNRANDVHAMLELNRIRAKLAGEFELKPMPPRRSRRKRDFWLMALIVNIFCVGFCAAVSRFSPLVMFYGFACGCFFTGALAWIMFFVMDDY